MSTASARRAYTPFPNALLDTVMPRLSDTEWRVLCVIVRTTRGWEAEDGQRKATDWLTQSQLKARTGRASEALSRAVDGLVQKEIILVCNEVGELLATPQERRRCVGKMLFCLAPQTRDAPHEMQNAQDTPTRPSQTQAAQEQDEPQEVSSSLSEHATPQSEQRPSESEQGYSVSEVRKAKTTKETKDKRTPDGAPQEDCDNVEKGVDNRAPGRTKRAEDASTERKASNLSEVQRFLRAYQEQFARHSPGGEAPPIAWGRDGRLVKGLLAQYGYKRLLELLTRFFASQDVWVKKRGYALSCFPTLLPTLLMEKESTAQAKRRAFATPVVVHGPSAQHWQHSGDAATPSASLFERYPHLRKKLREQPP